MTAPEPASTSAAPIDDDGGARYWRRNLFVALFGVFANIFALSLVIPFLPIYVEELGITGHANISQWSGIAYGVTYFAAAIVSPLWGRLADRTGRKLTLVRSSFGITFVMILLALVQNVWQLVAMRFVAGILGGYAAAANILVATQAPRSKSGWALGTLASGIMAGGLVGPLVGGAIQPIIGIRGSFFVASAMIFIAFLLTVTLIKEEKRSPVQRAANAPRESAWAMIPDKTVIWAMLFTAFLLMVANMSIEPILTLYVGQLVDNPDRVSLISGVVLSASALGSVLAASRVGKLGDRIGARTVVMGGLAIGSLLLIPQAFVTNEWQLIGLRFLMGVALAGLLPSITSVIRLNVPNAIVGLMLGYATSAQFAGQVAGPLVGGFVGGHLGMEWVFLGTSVLMMFGALVNWRTRNLVRPARPIEGRVTAD